MSVYVEIFGLKTQNKDNIYRVYRKAQIENVKLSRLYINEPKIMKCDNQMLYLSIYWQI